MRSFIVLLLAGLVVSCSENTLESRLESYNQKLARVLNVSLENGLTAENRTTAKEPIALPGVRALQHPLTDATIDLIDFLKLGGCELQQTIAERNSSLGKFAAPSIQLLQEYEFVRLANDCLPTISNSELKQTIQSTINEKRARLHQTIWNAIIAGPEYRLFWRVKVQTYPANVDSRVDVALSRINQQTLNILAMDPEIDWLALEQALEVIRGGEAGALLESWRLMLVHLSQATAILEKRLAEKPLCYPDMKNQNAEIFRNVVLKDFIAGIQRDAAILNRRYYDLMIPIRELEDQLRAAELSAYTQFRNKRDATFSAGRDALKTHVAALQPLMVQCGYPPEQKHE